MLLGEWEKGNLKEGSTVEFRGMWYNEYAEDNIQESKGTFNDRWENGWFIHDEAEGTYSQKYIVIPEGETWNELIFTGKLKVNSGEFLRGILRFPDGTYFYGDFKDNDIYTGTFYNADRSVDYYVKNGERVD